jgi:hypothetical protein
MKITKNLRTVGVPAEIRTEHLSNTSQKRSRFSLLTQFSGYNYWRFFYVVSINYDQLVRTDS